LRNRLRKSWAESFGYDAEPKDTAICDWDRCGAYRDFFFECKKTSALTEFEHYNIVGNLTGHRGTEIYKELLKPIIVYFPKIKFFCVAEKWENFGYGYEFSFYMFDDGYDASLDDGWFDGDNGEFWFVKPEDFDAEKHGKYYVVTETETIGIEGIEENDLNDSDKNQAQCDYWADRIRGPRRSVSRPSCRILRRSYRYRSLVTLDPGTAQVRQSAYSSPNTPKPSPGQADGAFLLWRHLDIIREVCL
jgi:hypothetical protein